MSTTTERGTIADFIRDHRLAMTAERTDSNPNLDDSRNMDHWKVIIVKGRTEDDRQVRRLTTYFSMGYGHGGKAPELKDVLDCLASDANGVQEDFEDWCSEYGYDTDSRKAERTYKACARTAAQLRRLLGDDGYETLVYHTDRE